MLRLRFTGAAENERNRDLTHHRRGDDDANAQDDGAGDNGRGHVLFLDDFLMEIAGGEQIEQFVASDRCDDTACSEDEHVKQGAAEGVRLQVARANGGRTGRCRNDRRLGCLDLKNYDG